MQAAVDGDHRRRRRRSTSSSCQLVKLFRAGEPVKMSKRSGDFVTLREVVEEVGVDPIRFMMVFRKNDAPLDFDFHKVTEQSKDNPVFYVQYAHARTGSYFARRRPRCRRSTLVRRPSGKPRSSVSPTMGELALIRRFAGYPRMLEGPPKRMSHTASLSIFMTLRPISTGIGIVARSCRNCALSTSRIRTRPWRDLPSFMPQNWCCPQDWLFLVSAHRRRCADNSRIVCGGRPAP